MAALPSLSAMAAALLFVVSPADAQVWGTQGSWSVVVPSPGSFAPALPFQHMSFVPGTLLVMGNGTLPTSQQQDIDLYRYNVATNTWTAPFDFPPQPSIAIPYLFSYGGLAIVVDEMAPNVMYFVDSAAPSGAWTRVSVSGAPINRVALRFMNWGSTLFFYGGFNPFNNPPSQSNDLWSLDLTTAILNPLANTPWQQVSPPGDPVTGLVPNYPPPRVGYSWTAYEVGSFMYGGLSYDGPGGDPFRLCLFVPPNAPKDPLCHWHGSVWMLLPSYLVGGQVPASAWVRSDGQGVNGGPLPLPRVGHTGGRMGNQMYIFGGVTPNGPTSELWAYDLMTQNWALTRNSGAQPPAFGGWATSVSMGYSLWAYVQQSDPTGQPIPNSGALYKWSPALFTGGPSDSASNVSFNNPIISGLSAVATLAVLLAPKCGLCAQNKAGPGGYYAASVTAGAIGSAYEAPAL